MKRHPSQPVRSKGRPSVVAHALGLAVWLVAVSSIGCIWPQPAVRLTHDLPAPVVVAGRGVEVTVAFKNEGATRCEVEVRLRVFQASSSTRMPLGPARTWKRLEVLAGQTILEAMPLELPAVRALTRFEVDCEDDAGNRLGTLAVLALPEYPLQQMSKLLGERLIALIPGSAEVEELLKENRISLAAPGGEFEPAQSRLVIFLPDAAPAAARAALAKRAQSLSAHGAAVLWVKFRPETRLRAPVIVRSGGAGAIVSASLSSVVELRRSSAAQLELFLLIRLALQPQEWQSRLEVSEDTL